MKERRVVVILGNSLLMVGLETSLRGKGRLDVARIDVDRPEADEQLQGLSPDVVIFDLESPDVQAVVEILQKHPGLPFLGLCVASESVLAFPGQVHTALTTCDLMKLVEDKIWPVQQEGRPAVSCCD